MRSESDHPIYSNLTIGFTLGDIVPLTKDVCPLPEGDNSLCLPDTTESCTQLTPVSHAFSNEQIASGGIVGGAGIIFTGIGIASQDVRYGMPVMVIGALVTAVESIKLKIHQGRWV